LGGSGALDGHPKPLRDPSGATCVHLVCERSTEPRKCEKEMVNPRKCAKEMLSPRK
jgi:hypothetical protein